MKCFAKNENEESVFLAGAGHRLCSVFNLSSVSLICLVGDHSGRRSKEAPVPPHMML